MMIDTLLKPLLPRPAARCAEPGARTDEPDHGLGWRALQADPALTGRVTHGPDGTIVLTGANGGPPPASLKERQRWELHVRLRLAVELEDDAAAAGAIRWAVPGGCR